MTLNYDGGSHATDDSATSGAASGHLRYTPRVTLDIRETYSTTIPYSTTLATMIIQGQAGRSWGTAAVLEFGQHSDPE